MSSAARTTPVSTSPAATSPAVALEEIRALIAKDLPTLPASGAEGGLAGVRNWLLAASGGKKPDLRHPRIALFARGDAHLADIRKGSAPVCALAQQGNADLQVYEMPETAECSPEDIAHACAYGMMAVQPGIDLLVLATLDDSTAIYKDMEALAADGRRDIAALAGALVAARLAKIPVILDGAGAKAAADILCAINPDAAAHAQFPVDILQETANTPAPIAGALLVPFLRALASS
jgi:nicotinate-nucleotide--dimethylbenzimidazole phosphoribosyltransferase